jgi:hypothetical protein
MSSEYTSTEYTSTGQYILSAPQGTSAVCHVAYYITANLLQGRQSQEERQRDEKS